MHRDLPLHHAVAPVGVAADELGGGLFAGNAGGGLEIHVVGFVDVEACDLADHALLHQLLGEVALLDELIILHQDLQILRADDHPAARHGNALAAQGTLCGQGFLVGSGGGAGGLGGGNGRAAGGQGAAGFQCVDGLFVDGQGQGVTGAVQAFGGDAVGHGCRVVAVDKLVHGFVLVNVQIQIGGGAGLQIHAGGFVVGLDADLRIAHGDLHLARFGVALVLGVEDGVVAGDKGRPQLCIHKGRITFLICMCHNKAPFLRASAPDSLL